MTIIGLTGGIASGKSTVSRILERLGAVVIDADQLAREAVMPDRSAHQAIVAAFGEGVLLPDGTIDRTALGRIIFADPSARKRLEAITHPAIRELAEQRLAELRRSGVSVAVYMAALLIEAGATDRVDEVWVVYVDRETQVRRVMARDGLSRSEAEQRLAAQMPMEEKAERGQVVINNNGTPEELERRVKGVWSKRFP